MKVKKILVSRSGAIGDVLMTTPLLRNLREHFPDSKISFLVGKWSKNALKNNPCIDEIISFDDKIIFSKNIIKIAELIRKIRKKQFDLCFVLDKSLLWGLFTFLCKIPLRIGFSRGKEGLFNTHNLIYDGTMHEIDYNLKLLKKIGKKIEYTDPEIYTTKKDKAYAKKLVNGIKKKNRSKVIGIAPGGAENPGQALFLKRWPIEYYIGVCDSFPNYNFIILGSKEDSGTAKEIIKSCKNKHIYSSTRATIQQSKEIIEKCDLFLSHDSGSMHIASTTKTKIIALFGVTPKHRFGPKNAILIQSPVKSTYDIYGKYDKSKNYMKKILPEQISKVIKKIFAK